MNFALRQKTFNQLQPVGHKVIASGTHLTDSLGEGAKIVGITMDTIFGGTCEFILATEIAGVITTIGHGQVTTAARSLSWWAGVGAPSATMIQPLAAIPTDQVNAFLPRGHPARWSESAIEANLILVVTTTLLGNLTVKYTMDDVPREGFHG
tara:strand:- start:5247 stop:5702 length:456 start_codon:yes stop_codon:yes gene_type:complete